MAKTRLNMSHRTLLERFAAENISCPSEDKANAKAYDRASALVRKEVEKKYLPADMAVLLKYNSAQSDTCINGGTPAGAFIRFQFTDAAHAPVTPSHNCYSRSISFTQAASDAIDTYAKARDALEKAQLEKLRNYRALISSARYFEEVAEVWPAVLTLRDKIVAPSTSLVALSDDVREFIQQDNAGEQLAA